MSERKANNPKIEELLNIYGNAMFDCGEWQSDDGFNEYDALYEKVKSAKAALLDAIEVEK